MLENQYERFIKDIIERLLKQSSLPKMQIERTISSLLELYIENIINAIFYGCNQEIEKIKLISSEYPIKNENDNRSSNMDYLLADEGSIYIVELKTAFESRDDDQFIKYLEYANRILENSNSLNYIKSDIKKLATKNKNYNYLIKYVELEKQVLKHFELAKTREIQKVHIVYITPTKSKEKLEEKYEKHRKSKISQGNILLHWVTLSETADIPCRYLPDVWKYLQYFLREIDA